jgi:hypothetical protein
VHGDAAVAVSACCQQLSDVARCGSLLAVVHGQHTASPL